jgi:hypothetical protein
MPARVAVWVIATSGGSGVVVTTSSAGLGTASVLGEQTEASAQVGEDDSVWARVV